MSMKRINLGLGLKLPYECGYSMLRRTLAANAGMSLKQFRKCYWALTKHDKYLFDKIERLNPELADISKRRKNRITYTIIRNCPECARFGYHTFLFWLDWVHSCPMHGVPLIENCLECGQPWPDLNDIHEVDCPACGLMTTESMCHDSFTNFKSEVKSIMGPVYAAFGKGIQYRQAFRIPGGSRFHDIITHWSKLYIDNSAECRALMYVFGDQVARKTVNRMCNVLPAIKVIEVSNESVEAGYLGHETLINEHWSSINEPDAKLSGIGVQQIVQLVRQVMKMHMYQCGTSEIIVRDYRGVWLDDFERDSRSILNVAFSIWLLYLLTRGAEVAEQFNASSYALFRAADIKDFRAWRNCETIITRIDDSKYKSYKPSQRVKKVLYRFDATVLLIAIHRYLERVLLQRVFDRKLLEKMIFDESSVAIFTKDDSKTNLIMTGKWLSIEGYLKSYYRSKILDMSKPITPMRDRAANHARQLFTLSYDSFDLAAVLRKQPWARK